MVGADACSQLVRLAKHPGPYLEQDWISEVQACPSSQSVVRFCKLYGPLRWTRRSQEIKQEIKVVIEREPIAPPRPVRRGQYPNRRAGSRETFGAARGAVQSAKEVLQIRRRSRTTKAAPTLSP